MARGDRLEDRVAIVTGATVGIGAATAQLFAQEGARQVLVARHDSPLLARLREQHGQDSVVFVPGDVRNPETARLAVQTALSRFGGLHVLVNNAGVDLRARILETTADQYRQVFEVNFIGTFLMLREAAPVMTSAGAGSIVNLASRSALSALCEKSAYAASKAAVVALTKSAALELAPRVRVNAVAPGSTDTAEVRARFAAMAVSDDGGQQLTALNPQHRLARPEEVAACILFLACDESSHLTGAVIPVDGGATAGATPSA